MYRAAFPLVQAAAIAGAKSALDALIDELGIGLDWGVVNEAAIKWARQYTYELVNGITDTSARFLQTATSEWIASGKPLDELIGVIEPMFGELRAEMIAISEVTRCFAEGNLAAWHESGVVDEVAIMTAEDEAVCPICGEAAGNNPYSLTAARGMLPLHVRCRCWLQPVINLAKAMVYRLVYETMQAAK
jgi:SPP1 gp7 family putative phage head morphogenesis protein